jgi:hypothetical protein
MPRPRCSHAFVRALTLLFFSIATFLVGEIAHVMVVAANPYSTSYQLIDAMEVLGGLLFFFMAENVMRLPHGQSADSRQRPQGRTPAG